MNKSFTISFLLISLILLCSSCVTIYPIDATNNAIGEKVGRSKTTVLLGTGNRTNISTGIVFNQNFGVIEATKNGDIDTLATVDLKIYNYIFFKRLELIVTGN